jgi:hypothetical protein
MSPLPPVKLFARNVGAQRRARASQPPRVAAGNPVSTRLESGVGNCFPGLECDLRNLERRFFPFLEVDLGDNSITVVSVDLDGATASGTIPADGLQSYRKIARDVAAGRAWRVRELVGTFGPLGQLTLAIDALAPPSSGDGRRPPDAWTAVRLLTENTDVVLRLRGPSSAALELTGRRARYLDDNGALAAAFLPGELTQSLCSPWTHDFRDCGCYYWASNHPDIARPPLGGAAPDDPRFNPPVPWERRDRTIGTPPAPATADDPRPDELDYYEINAKWQTLNFVVGRREVVDPFSLRPIAGIRLGSRAELETFLRYAAGVELAVTQEYLTAAYSLRAPDGLPNPLADDIRAAHGELMRIAIGEMRHLRAVNDVLRGLADPGAFKPALQVASRIPGVDPGTTRPVQPRPASLKVIDEFIDIERPSVSVDGVYARILATFEHDGPRDLEQSIRTIMAEGEDHYEAFLAIREWLGRHPEGDFLRALTPPPANDPAHQTLQATYRTLLERLHTGYSRGIRAGAGDVVAARSLMIGPGGIDASAQAVTERGFIVTFAPIDDPRFGSVAPP